MIKKCGVFPQPILAVVVHCCSLSGELTELRNGHESEYADYLFFALHCTVRERARIQESFAPSKKILLNFYLFFLKMIAFPLLSKYC